MHRYKEFLDDIKDLDCYIIENEPMKLHTTFKIGGPADFLIKVNTKNSLVNIILSANKYDIPYFVLGNGSNILVNDNGIRGIVLKLEGEFKTITMSSKRIITCGAGVFLSQLASYAKFHSLTGLEFLWGIPGSVGGALYMNAGAYNSEMKDVVCSAGHITKEGKRVELNVKNMDLSYRHSIYSSDNNIITFVSFSLKEGMPLNIQGLMDDLIKRRKDKQPLEYPSAGSTFKRPPQNFAGALIEGCSLKGKKIGGAMVSEKHSGFIVNTGNASCKDVLDLIDFVRATVLEKTSVLLEPEVKFIPENI